MINGITSYILVFFMALSGLFGGLSYHFYGAKAEAESALIVAIDANTELQKSLNLQVDSCTINDASVVEVEAEKATLQSKLDSVVEQISKLTSGLKKPVNTKDIPNVEKQSDFLAGDELLSPALQRLLNAAYCIAEPTDQLCLTPTKPTD